ncbi:MAG: helix-turn-helix transcriptional regulator [Planctomycetota bacterium]|jgi:hypothetical protein
MNEINDQNSVSICSFSQMASMLGLSRTRLYQLNDKGIFPPPVYSIANKRPCYTINLQNTCFQIRKTGIGYNGHPIIFNAKKKNRQKKSPKPVTLQHHSEFVEALGQIGLKVSPTEVRKAIEGLFPDCNEPPELNGKIINELHRHFKEKQ